MVKKKFQVIHFIASIETTTKEVIEKINNYKYNKKEVGENK
jgi:hypothetical protein